MAREHMCAYGNCSDTDTPVTVSNNTAGRRDRYCSWLHAALGCLGNETNLGRRGLAANIRAEAEKMIEANG